MYNTIEVAAGSLAYEIAGSGGPASVLLHSGPLNMRMWDPQFEYFAALSTTVRYDARGYGRSSPSAGDYSHPDDLHELLTRLGIPRTRLVGVSLGARTAINFALDHPDMVDGLILGSPGISGAVTSDPFILDNEAAVADAVAALDADALIEVLLRMWVDGPHRTAGQLDPGLRGFCREMAYENLPKQAAATGRAVELNAARRLGALTCPVLVVVGALDSLDILDNAHRIAADAPNSLIVTFDDCGHEVNLEQPDRFTELCAAFLDTGTIPATTA